MSPTSLASEGARVNPARSWKRIDGVDCLRALAIFYVLLNHVNMRLLFAHVPYTAGMPRALVTALVWQGQRGVQIFFAVSGFLITSTTIKRWGSLKQVKPRDFYLIRFARIAPLLLALLAVLSVLHALHLKNFVVSSDVGGLPNALFAALTLHVGWLEATRGYLPGNWDILWSLSVEEMFYLFFPMACLLLGRGRKLVALLCLFVVMGPFARTIFTHENPVWREYSYLGGMDAIAMGCLTALVLAHCQLSRIMIRLSLVCGVVGMTFILCCDAQARAIGLVKTGLDMTVLGVAACLVIAVAAQSRWQAPRWLSPVLAYGRRSYEIYLTHMFVVFAGFALFLRAGKAVAWTPVLFVAVIAIAGVLGEAVARFFSEPANRWLRERFGDGAKRLGSVVETT